MIWYHFSPARMTRIKKTAVSIDKDEEELRPSYFPDGNVKWYSFGKQSGNFFRSYTNYYMIQQFQS
jgi:hypothetical protein